MTNLQRKSHLYVDEQTRSVHITKMCNDLLELAVVATVTKDIDLTDLALNMILTTLHYVKSCRPPSAKAAARNRKTGLCKFG